jgi:hypothetical protein
MTMSLRAWRNGDWNLTQDLSQEMEQIMPNQNEGSGIWKRAVFFESVDADKGCKDDLGLVEGGCLEWRGCAQNEI